MAAKKIMTLEQMAEAIRLGHVPKCIDEHDSTIFDFSNYLIRIDSSDESPLYPPQYYFEYSGELSMVCLRRNIDAVVPRIYQDGEFWVLEFDYFDYYYRDKDSLLNALMRDKT